MLNCFIKNMIYSQLNNVVHIMVGIAIFLLVAYTAPLWHWAISRIWTHLLEPALRGILGSFLLSLLKLPIRFVAGLMTFIADQLNYPILRRAVWTGVQSLTAMISGGAGNQHHQCSGILDERDLDGGYRCKERGRVEIDGKFFCFTHGGQGRDRAAYEARNFSGC